MENNKNMKCSLFCDYISNTDDPYTGDILSYCNYDKKRCVGFIEDVDHGREECFFPHHDQSSLERLNR